MTVSSSTNRVSYSGNGSTTVFPYTYKIFDEDDLTVILRAANGTETVKTITSDYTVSGVGNAGGGNVTMLTAPASGETLVILREQDLVQELDIVPNDPFPADSLEAALDKLTFMVQQHEETLDRTIKASRTNTISGAEFTISAADRANKLLSFDSSGDLNITQELGTYRGDWAASTAYAQRDIVKDGGNDNLYFCNTAHTSSGSLPISSNADVAKWDLLLDVAAFSSLYDQFDDRYLGAKSSDPATDNDGNTLLDGALYWNTTDNRLKVYDLGNTAWKFTAPSPTEQANIDALAPIAADVAAVGAIDTDVTAVAGITANVTTVAGIAPNVTTVAGISADVTAVAADATDIGTVATGIADVSTVAGIAGNVTTVAGISGNVTTVAGISANVTTVAGVSADVTTVAGVSADVSTVAGISANVTTVAGISADVTTVAANVAGVTSFAEKYRVGATDPTTSLDTGDLFYNTSSNLLKVYNGSAWETGVTPGSGFLSASNNLSDVADAATARTNLGLGTAATGDVGTDVLAYDANLQGFVDAFTLPTTDGTADQVIKTDGSGNLAFADAGGGADLQEFTASGTWTKPAGATFVMVEIWGAGGGGASGCRTNGTLVYGGSGGGGGGYAFVVLKASDLSATETITIGAGGAGGAATSGFIGNNGTSGGASSFGSFLKVGGGQRGVGQDTNTPTATGAGGSLDPDSFVVGDYTNNSTAGPTGALNGGNSGSASFAGFFGGGNGGVNARVGGGAFYGGAGGGSGGRVNSSAGQAGARGGGIPISLGAAGGAIGGNPGSSGTVFRTGGGGGSSSPTLGVNGGAGGNGAIAGGGGGGGCSYFGVAGAGGTGGNGYCRVYTW